VTVRVVEITADETHPLRRQVLRHDTPSEEVVFDGDDLPTTFHLGLRVGDELVAVSTWVARAYPDRPAEVGFQVRGMATSPSHRGRGHGARLLAAGIDRCVGAGATLVWARARDSALAFYTAYGFEPVGLGYVDLTTALPHHDVLRSVP
jgi:predicted GNAT family N-acyltransferase